jgi:hypothetical protein
MAACGTVAALQRASKGLSYQSEADAPWTVVRWPSAEGEPNGEAVRARDNHDADAPVAEQSVEEFFAPLVEDQDWYEDEEKAVAEQYRSLLSAIKERLVDTRVVRVGERQVSVYVVGRAKEGGWAGLKTTAVET